MLRSLGIATVLTFFPASALGDPPPLISKVEQVRDDQGSRFCFNAEFTTISISGVAVNSLGASFGFFHAPVNWFGAGFTVRQGFSSASLTALFSELDMQLQFALTGSLRRRREILRLDGHPTVQLSEGGSGGLRAQVFIHQYYFHTGLNAVPFPGFGGGLTYEFPSSGSLHYSLGLRMDAASNGIGTTLFPIHALVGIGLWL